MKRWIIGLSALGAVVTAGAWAQDRGSRDHDFGGGRGWRGGQHGPLSAEDRAAFADARLAALKAGLKLNPDQEKLWPAVEEAMRSHARQRSEARQAMRERFSALREGERRDVPEMLRAQADRQAASADAIRKLADAMTPLYATLDDGQKRRLAVLGRGMMRGTGPVRGGFGRAGGGERHRL
ncbi:MAG: hypothetical protein JWR08_2379 [Enterovirga sp.]|jgi:zinc resistance-associated protein|nr:hypothetical protein [Enterovirga sp.]